jgi:outer membrane cobalamin receptor
MQKKKLLRLILFPCFLLSLPFALLAQDPIPVQDTLNKKDTLDYYEMSIEQLQKLKAVGVSSELEKLINSLIGVASKKPLSTRESPSIVSLITREEIQNSGARDLIDVLQLVPGIDFGVDVEGVVGMGMRGNWVHEGKVLLLLDGQEMNETLFGTTQFGNHFSIDQIKKIEIIRGPGSAIYGGYAEYGVINIITRDGEDINGAGFSTAYGQMKDTYGRRNVNFSIGKKTGELNTTLSGFFNQGHRSDQVFTDLYGGTYDMAKHSNLDVANVNLGLAYKGLNFRFITDQYQITSADSYDTVTAPYKDKFNSTFSELKYSWKINDKLNITPKINYKHQTPWKAVADDTPEPYFKIVDRYTGNITATYNYNRKLNIVFGGEIYNDRSEDKLDSSYYSDNSKKISYLNEAVFAQALLKFRLVNVILGARFDNHSEYGNAFVPRLGLTKKIQKFHFKLLYSNSFRAPSIENINLRDSTGMKPEKTSVFELELGYQLSRRSILTVNLFDINTTDAIVYYVDPVTNLDAYHNIGKNGSWGVEAEYKIKDKWGYLGLNYSFYSVSGKDIIADYQVPQNSNVLLAFPAHKINLNSSFYITKHLSINPSVSFRGDRYAITAVDSLDNGIVEKIPSSVFVNLFIRYENVVKGLDFGAGVYDIFNEQINYIQPYNSNHAPLPGPSRELILKLSYHLNFKEKEDKR